VIPQGIRSILKQVPEILEDGENGLPGTMRNLLERLTENLKEMDRQAKELEAQIQLWHRENAASRKLAEIPGLGPITASAIVATVGGCAYSTVIRPLIPRTFGHPVHGNPATDSMSIRPPSPR
jgi:transposase